MREFLQLMQSDRRGQSRSVLGAVESRHKAIQNIEKQIVELARLFEDLNALVVQQDPMIHTIEQKGEEVQDNVVKGNVEMDGAITKARSARRKKWYCLLITGKYHSGAIPRWCKTGVMSDALAGYPFCLRHVSNSCAVIILIIVAVVVAVVVVINNRK